MATRTGIAKISESFRNVYGQPIPEEAYDLWLRVFSRISDIDLERAMVHLIETREKGSKVTPGEISKALLFYGIAVHPHEQPKTFRNDPMVKALESHYRAEEAGKQISMAEWLREEGLGSFREAMEKYADHPGPTFPRSSEKATNGF